MAENEVKTSKTKKAKKVKAEKTYPAKKLPGLFKKSYTQKKFDKKIIGALYIQKDKDDVLKLFVTGANEKKPDRLAIPRDNTFTKAQLKRFKAMAKDIKKNAKFRIALLPFAAVVTFIAALAVVISIFKNPLVKRGIIAACEGIFGAKTEVDYVNLEFFDATLTVKGLAVGNKDSVYKNLFEAEKIELSFNLTQLLRGKFICKNIECSGMNFNTDRTESCELPKKQKKPSEESAFVKELKARSSKAVEDLKAQAFDFAGGSDVDSIVQNFMAQLKTFEASDAAKQKALALTDKWKSKPSELKTQVDTFGAQVKDLQNLNVNSLGSDPVKIKDAISKVQKAVDESNSIKSSISQVSSDVKKDAADLKAASDELAKAVASDKKFVSEKAGEIASVVGNPSGVISNAVSTVGYNMLGSYYPYAEQLMNYALEAKRTAATQKKSEKKSDEERTSKRKRMEGVTFWYAEEYPGFLVERVFASGPNFEGKILEISSNQDVRNKPTVSDVKFDVGKISHSANLVIDARSSSNADLLTARYAGKGFKADFNGAKISSKAGIPSVTGDTTVSVKMTGDVEGLSLSGAVRVNPATVTSDGFENESFSKYYQKALSAIKDISLKFTAGYKSSSGMIFDVSGNIEQQFAKAFNAAAGEAFSDVKGKVAEKLNEKINASNSEATEKVKEFLGIQGDIDVQSASIENIQKSLNSKIAELEKKASGSATKAATKTLEKAGVDTGAAGKAAGKAASGLKKLF